MYPTRHERGAVEADGDAGDDVLVLAQALQQAALLGAVAADAVVPASAAGNHLLSHMQATHLHPTQPHTP